MKTEEGKLIAHTPFANQRQQVFTFYFLPTTLPCSSSLGLRSTSYFLSPTSNYPPLAPPRKKMQTLEHATRNHQTRCPH